MTVSTIRTSALNAPAAATNFVDASSGATTLSLGLASATAPGTSITVIKKDSSLYAVTVEGGSGETLGVLDSQNDSMTFNCDGVSWTTSESEAGVGTKLNLGVFGDGLDGDRTITTPQSLPNNVFYRNLTIEAGGSLATNGWAVFVSNLLTLAGDITFDGADGQAGADGGAAGAAVARGYLGGSGAGGAGSANNGSAGAAVTNTVCGVGGQGGNGDPGTGASAGANSVFPDANGGARVMHQLVPAMTGESQGQLIETGTGGGGGGGDATKKGGGGGASGGYLLLCARAMVGTGTISAAGGDGGAGDPSGNTGGGGGGGGGLLVVISETQLPATITTSVAAGQGGVKGGTGADGDDGEDGTFINLYGVK